MITDLDQLIPREQYEPYLEGRPLDYLQPLVDLGFLRFSETENKTSVQFALKEFRSACQNLSWLSNQENNLPSSLPPLDEPDSLEIKLLHLLVDMDGDFQLSKLPDPGSLDILTRVIFYRLRLHGFWKPGDEPQPFDPDILDAVIAKVSSWIPLEITTLQWMNLLGDIPELIRQTYDHGQLDRQIVCFKYRPRKAFKDSFRQEILRESANEVKSESNELQQIKTELKELKKDQVTVATTEPPAATTRKNRRRQSEVEMLRIEINAVVEQIRNTLDERHQASNKFQPAILAAKEELRIAKLAEDHHKIDLKELKNTRKSLDDLKGDTKKLQRKNKKLRKELDALFPNIADLGAQLIIQLNTHRQLQEHQNSAPDDLKHKFDKTIDSAEKKITLLKEYFAREEQLDKHQERLLDRASLDEQIASKEKEGQTLKNEVVRIENGLAILLERQKDEVDEFEDGIEEEKKKLRKISDRYKELLKKLKNIPRRFRRELKEYLAPDFYQKVRSELLDRENATLFTQTLNHPYNQFLVRLLQLHQWTNGYYNGLIDSDLGRRTFRSIREIDQDIKGLKLRFVLYQLNAETGTWLLNIRYLFAEMMDSLESFQEENDFETVVQKYETEIAENPDIRNQKKRIDRELEKAIKEANKNRVNNKLRRVYFGVRSLARSIVRGMGRLVRLILKGLKFIYRLLKNFVLMLYREIREGLRKFGQGIAFLFGKRQITTSFADGSPAIVSRFDFDCDVKCFANLGAGEHIRAHRNRCYSITHNLQFALVLTAKIIEWAVRAISLTWATILIRIALYFRKQIKAFLKKNIIGLTVKAIKG